MSTLNNFKDQSFSQTGKDTFRKLKLKQSNLKNLLDENLSVASKELEYEKKIIRVAGSQADIT